MKTIVLRGRDYTEFMINRDHARARTKKSLFDAVGPFRLLAPSRRILTSVRSDPGEPPAVSQEVEATSEVTDDKMERQIEQQKRQRHSGQVARAPSPKNCACSQWPLADGEEITRDDRGKQTEHRRTCAWKKKWERQSGKVKQAQTTILTPRITKAQKPVNTSNPLPALTGSSSRGAIKLKEKLKKVPSPDDCPECGNWSKPKKHTEQYPNQHHPLCQHFKKYLAISSAAVAVGVAIPTQPFYLFNVGSQEQVREAEADEIAEARARLRDEGTPLCEVDGEQYLVLRGDGEMPEPAEAETKDTEPPPAEVELK